MQLFNHLHIRYPTATVVQNSSQCYNGSFCFSTEKLQYREPRQRHCTGVRASRIPPDHCSNGGGRAQPAQLSVPGLSAATHPFRLGVIKHKFFS